MHRHLEVIMTVGLWLGLAVAFAQETRAQQNPVTAIDIVLEPDATMVQRARDALGTLGTARKELRALALRP